MRKYETIFILDPTLDNNAIEAEISKYSAVITANGGNILKQDKWGLRNLAYHIGKKSQGYYVFTLFEGKKETLTELERVFGLDEQVLRHLTVVLGKKQAMAQEKTRELAAQA